MRPAHVRWRCGVARPETTADQDAPATARSTPTSTSASKISSADRSTIFVSGSTQYVPLFEGASDVLDVGCGRGEFLDLLRENGITARGVDLNDEMAAVSRERGLDATAGDALDAILQAQPDGSLGGLFAAQVVEHLEPDYLMRFLDAAYHKLRPGSKIVLETINPACWFAFFSSYIRDITHVRPLHPDTLQYLLRASGFQNVERPLQRTVSGRIETAESVGLGAAPLGGPTELEIASTTTSRS